MSAERKVQMVRLRPWTDEERAALRKLKFERRRVYVPYHDGVDAAGWPLRDAPEGA